MTLTFWGLLIQQNICARFTLCDVTAKLFNNLTDTVFKLYYILTLHLFLDPSHIHQHKYNSQDYEDHRCVPSQTSQHAQNHCAPSNSVITATKTEEYKIFHYNRETEFRSPTDQQRQKIKCDKKASVNQTFLNP